MVSALKSGFSIDSGTPTTTTHPNCPKYELFREHHPFQFIMTPLSMCDLNLKCGPSAC